MEYEMTDEQREEITDLVELFSSNVCRMLDIKGDHDMMLSFRVAKCIDDWIEDCKRAGVLKDD